MDWSNEDYVRLYTRETDDDLVLSWEARAVWHEMLKKFDRSGLIAMRRGRRGLAALIRVPLEVVERVMPELLDDGRVAEIETGYVSPNFLEAQEANKSDRQRQRESRQRRRADSLAGTLPVTKGDGVITDRDESSRNEVTIRDRSSHDPPPLVTLISADPDPLHASATRPPADPHEQALVRRQLIRRQIWGRLGELRASVAAELGLTVRPLPAHDPGERELASWIVNDGDRVEADAAHVLEVYAAEARASRSVQWLTGAMFEERPRRRALGMTVEDARRPRPPTRSSPSTTTAEAPVSRPMKTFT